LESRNFDIIRSNLSRSALKIEKKNNTFRFLYFTSAGESFAFREITKDDFNFKPGYVGIFAIRGWSDSGSMPVFFDTFILDEEPCRN
jgi:hypothetical protein